MCSAGSRSGEPRIGDDEGEKGVPPDLDRDVRAGEQQRAAAERPRDRDRHHEAREHDRQHEQPHRDGVRVELVRDPGRVVPRPPDDEQDEQRLSGAAPGQVVEQQVRDLRDREDEDEVVEELEVRGVLLLVGRLASGAGSGSRSPPRLLGSPAWRCAAVRLRDDAARRRALGLGRRQSDARPSTSVGLHRVRDGRVATVARPRRSRTA